MNEMIPENFTVKTSVTPTLQARDYSNANRYASELSAIFEREWIYALHVSQLSEIGSYQTFEIGDKPILLVRSADGSVRAFYNVCVHRGHALANGCGVVKRFSCPYHAWTYDLDGRLRSAPGVGEICDLPEKHRGLVPVETAIKDGFVFIRLSPGARNLGDLYGKFFEELNERLPALDRLRFAKRFIAEVDGNWKIMVENYLECYHCSPTHPALADLMCIRDYTMVQSEYFLSTRAPAGRADNIAYKYVLKDDSQREFSGWWLWPNATFNIFPGQQNLLVFHMLPLSPERSIGYCDYFFIDGKVDDEAQALMDWEGHILEKEDNDLIVAAHKGMKAQVLPHGIFVVNEARHDVSESPLAHFNALVAQAVDGKTCRVPPC